ncbi:hypothetical protein UY416_24230 [Paenibacillus polymyxa]|uniref:hypothetical protein n=1 Tax=Paenibacillus polymyxa TaxID=1406 RepID=UPI002AB525D5|nr:hypothetical protein [Paenibacillus polymyxa]MDY8049404.1 hypothetical protein [Paenibacillus polymyxa]
MQQFIIEQIHHIFTWIAHIDWNRVIDTLFDWLKKVKIILDFIPFVMPQGTAKRGRKRYSSYRRAK